MPVDPALAAVILASAVLAALAATVLLLVLSTVRVPIAGLRSVAPAVV